MEIPFKSIIIDDEQHAIDLLNVLLQYIDEVQVEKTFTSPLEAIRYLTTHDISLIFLDIQMPEISGIDFVKKLFYVLNKREKMNFRIALQIY